MTKKNVYERYASFPVDVTCEISIPPQSGGIVTAYIAGPMRGIKHYNFEAFENAENYLKSLGVTPINPHKIDLEITGKTALDLPDETDWSELPKEFNIKDVARRDINALLSCDFVYLLKGYMYSHGATAELMVARWADMTIFYEDNPWDLRQARDTR